MAMQPDQTVLGILLAAGMGTRMKSNKPKVMHSIGGEPMVVHALRAAKAVAGSRAVVVGPDMQDLEDTIGAFDPNASCHRQVDRLGTGHAAQMALSALGEIHEVVVVMFGDTPFIRSETIAAAASAIKQGASVAVLGFEAKDPTGYGRLLQADGQLVAIREEAAATSEERTVTFCNSGVMAFAAKAFEELLSAIGQDNPKGEFYLTDAVEIANDLGLKAVAIDGDEAEFLGVNSRVHLAEAEAIFQAEKRREMMDNGVTLVAPETVFFAADTIIGKDTLVEPNCFFGPGVVIGEGCTVRAFSHIEGATLSENVVVGPYARLRPGAELLPRSRVGNFVEIKATQLGEGAKVNHLSYIGDASVGAATNIGAGTITCNYDGFSKSRTEIGKGVFVGSNSTLVAPLSIEDEALVAAGSTITSKVEPNALAFGRARQTFKSDRGMKARKT